MGPRGEREQHEEVNALGKGQALQRRAREAPQGWCRGESG